MKSRYFIAAAAVAAAMTATASAHPGSALLTIGKGERAAMSGGVSYEDINGVHLFKGARRLAGGNAAPLKAEMGAGVASEKTLTIIHRTPRRSFRTLRTQGFYSGTAPKSRRYTQGFYSGD